MNFTSPQITFSEQHIFSPGPSADTQILWVTYSARNSEIQTLEMHKLCQQVVVPLTGEIIQIVAASGPAGPPDLQTLRAFRIRPGQGICMRPGCWHTTRVERDDVNCLMLTRPSTTQDLIAHLHNKTPLSESQIVTLADPRTLA
jgi:ureidoglycolate lyase